MRGVPFVLSAALVTMAARAQEVQPPAATVERIDVPGEPSFEFDPVERAQKACAFDGVRWSCDKRLLDYHQIRRTSSTNAPSDLEAGVAPLFHNEKRCFGAIAIAFRHATAPLLIDWARTTIVMNGVAVQAVPGYARNMTSSLAQRPAAAPAGALLNESVFPISGDCIAPHDLGEPQVAVLEVPVRIGEREDVVRWTWKREWVSDSEAAVFSRIPAPRDPGPERAVADEEPKRPFPLWAVGGGASGALLAGGTVGGITGYLAYDSPVQMPVCTAISCSVCATGVGALAGTALGFVALDLPGINSHAAERETWFSDRIAHDQWRAESARLDAWIRRRQELGLTPSATSTMRM